MPFSIMGRTGPGMRQVVQFGDRSTERGNFWGEFGARHCNQWGLYGVRVRQRRDAALFPNYFEQTCSSSFMLLPFGEIKLNILDPLRQSPPVSQTYAHTTCAMESIDTTIFRLRVESQSNLVIDVSIQVST